MPPRALPALCLTLACAAFGGCGGGDDASGKKGGGDSSTVEVPAVAVAVVGDVPIPKARFARWFEAAAKPASEQELNPIVSTGRGFRALAVQYPRFATCVSARERLGAPTEPAREDCKMVFDRYAQQVMPVLIQAEWTRQAARARGLDASAAELRRAVRRIELDRRQAQARGEPAPSGMTRRDDRLGAETRVLQDELQAKKVDLATLGKRMRARTVCRQGYVVPLCGDTDKD